MTIDLQSRTIFAQGARACALASVAAIALCAPMAAHAQANAVVPATTAPDAAVATANNGNRSSDSLGGVGDIVVTARRDAENVQHIPVSVQVVTGDTLKKLSVNDASEISKLAPGLTLVSASDSASQKIVLRGVSWQPGSGTPATPIYFNEAPFDPADLLKSIFDIGQIEVLRGPQGTTRGAPSISGAVTITTRRPDMREFGGYIQGQYGEGKHSDFQGAINVPIIKDVLAIRAAADIQDSRGNRVYSVNSSINPKARDRVYRITAVFKPTDTLSIEAMYQYRNDLDHYYTQVEGPGSPGDAASGIPANFNGPALTAKDRKTVSDGPSIARHKIGLITVNATWDIFGNTLSYNFGRQTDHSGVALGANDYSNFLPGYEAIQRNGGGPLFYQTNEIRLSSIHDEDRPFDYDIGWFSKHDSSTIPVIADTFLTGAFGPPGTPPGAVTMPDRRYVLTSSTNVKLGQVFDSFYGGLRVYLDRATELSGGFSILRDRVPVNLTTTTGAASIVAAPLSALGGLPCAGIPGVFETGLVNSDYPGYCDFNIPAGAQPVEDFNSKYSNAIYNASISHRFGSSILAYATTGTSFRSGYPAIGQTGLPADLEVPKPEKATSYEVGVKTTLGRRLRVNADVFQINYKNQLTTFQGVPYYNTTSGTTALTSVAFYRNINARVRGAELEIASQPMDHLSLNANLSYSKISSRGGLVPCNNPSGPAITAANPVNFCESPKGQTLNQQAPFQATVNGSYDVPFTETIDGYFRFNVNYQGHNPNYGNFADPGDSPATKAYALVDLFAGVARHDGGWDLGVYVKNVFNKQAELSRAQLLNNIYAPYATAAVGYDQVTLTLPREAGVTLRYSFGSR